MLEFNRFIWCAVNVILMGVFLTSMMANWSAWLVWSSAAVSFLFLVLTDPAPRGVSVLVFQLGDDLACDCDRCEPKAEAETKEA